MRRRNYFCHKRETWHFFLNAVVCHWTSQCPLSLTFIPEARGPGLYWFLLFYTVPTLSSVVGLILGFTQKQVFPLLSNQYFLQTCLQTQALPFWSLLWFSLRQGILGQMHSFPRLEDSWPPAGLQEPRLPGTASAASLGMGRVLLHLVTAMIRGTQAIPSHMWQWSWGLKKEIKGSRGRVWSTKKGKEVVL